MRTWLIVLTLFVANAANAVPVWKWVDDTGQVHYTDVPVPGAERIELLGGESGESRTGAPQPSAETPAQRIEPAADAPAPSVTYRRFAVVQPSQQQTLWNIGAVLPVQVEIEPALQAGHHIDVFLDGRRVSIGATGAQFTVPEVYRGVHTMQAVIADANGQDLVRSPAVTFIVQQTSILNPNNRQPPAARNRAPN